jgi:glutathione S-transferase
MLQLVIGNKNYSSWSMRPWVLMRQLGIPFEERALRFDFSEGSAYRRAVAQVNPTGQVPVLLDGGFAVWDTLAITEYLHEHAPQANVWPADAHRRARARSLCAEMHAGFGALRSHCPMNIEAALPEVGVRIWAEQAAVQRDVARLESMWA